MVNSHLHFDHCGQNPTLFGTATTFYAQAAEFEAAEADGSYTDASWALCPREQRRALCGDERIADGVTVLATPGHTAGHQSVLVEAAGRRVAIGAQVVWHRDEFDAEIASEANVDPTPELRAAAVESIRRLKSLQPEVARVLRGWGAYFRYGNSNRKFAAIDSYVHWRLSKLASVKYATRGRLRTTRFNHDWATGLGIHRLTGSVQRWSTAHA